MKVVQTRLSDTEYSLLVAYAKSRKSTIKDFVWEAIRRLTIRREVDPDDPLFKSFPLSRNENAHGGRLGEDQSLSLRMGSMIFFDTKLGWRHPSDSISLRDEP